MIKFNEDHIFVGYLKQLLSDFNLPKYKIYTAENRAYYEANGKESPEIIETHTATKTEGIYPSLIYYANYIKGDEIMRYVDGIWKTTNKHYYSNRKILNQTKTLKIRNGTVYDSYTHEYLGDYLRFLRDYYDLDLMPLYNCFSDTRVANLTTTVGKSDFDSTDDQYQIYAIPVKLFKQYTIAIDCDTPVELFCGFYDKYLNTKSRYTPFMTATYKKYNAMKFADPVIYTGLTVATIGSLKNTDGTDFDLAELAQIENTLKLFIKLPVNNTSSITILEGNYTGYNNSVFRPEGGTWKKLKNHTVTNFEVGDNYPDMEDRTFNFITELQLLDANTQVSHPFADRLMEYLSDNAITSMDEEPDDIKRAQTVMEKNGISFTEYGTWQNKMRPIIYDYMNSYSKIEEANHDVLGYVDKDAEKYYASWVTEYVIGADGNYVPIRDSDGNIIYKTATIKHSLMTDSGETLLDKNNYKLIYTTTEYVNVNGETVTIEPDNTTSDVYTILVPAGYKTRKVATTTIANVDIYE